jgi:hypothetical protein
MYQFSRAIYRELAPHISPDHPGSMTAGSGMSHNHEHVLHACEAAIERLATDRYYFAKPERSLFYDIRGYFPMNAQERVYQVVMCYMGLAQQYMAENPVEGYAAVSGKPMMCRATTRKGAACQRVPLPHNGYCPSHQHLADTEDRLAA